MRDSFRATRTTLICCMLLVMMIAAGRAQEPFPTPEERPDFYTTVQDSIIVCLIDDVDTLNPNLVSGAYTFIMPYDSICTISYIFTEPWHNGRRLDLEHWFNGRSINAHEDLMSFNSRTENFKVRTGDTVRCYRQLKWNNPTGRIDTNSYFSRDTLGYVVELVDITTMARVALIDSMGLLPQTPPGKYRFYAHRNASAIASYVIPSWMDGDSVCMRVRVYARGPGEYYFTRYDNIKLNYSIGGLQHPVRMADLELLRKCCWVPIPLNEQFGKAVTSGSVAPIIDWIAGDTSLLSVHQEALGSPDVNIEIAAAPKLGELSIIIFDAHGAALSSPFSDVVSQARVIPYQFQSSGAYVVCLVHDGTILESQKVTITK